MIRLIQEKDIQTLAILHKKILPSFLAEYPLSFIEKFYHNQLIRKNQTLIGYFEGEYLMGFVFGSDDVECLYSNFIQQNKLYFYIQTLFTLLLNPNYLILFSAKFFAKSYVSDCKRQLVYIAVDKNSKQKGIGKQLVIALEEKWAAYPYYELEVESNNPAFHFYEKLGFKVVHTYNNWVEKKILMGKTLK